MRRLGQLLAVLLPWSALGATAGAPSSDPSAAFAHRYDELRRVATPAQLYRLLYALPKGGDLHNHAGGANLSEWTWAVLTDPARNGGDTFYTRARFTAADDAIAADARFHTLRQVSYDALPPAVQREYVPLTALTPAEHEDWLNAFRLDRPEEGRDEFFGPHWPRMGDVGRNLHVRTELLVENIKAFAAEGLAYLEIQFGVGGIVTNDGRAVSREEALAVVEERLAQPDVAATGLVVRFQEAVLRFSPRAEAALREEYAWVDAHRHRWVGLNLVGLEERGGGHPTRFLDTLRDLRRRHPEVPLSFHAGEMDGPGRQVRETLLLGARRVGHAVNLLHDPDTLLLLQQSRRVLIETNLISNRLLGYVPDLALHPFPEYLRTGIPVALCTDDRGMWDSNLTDEYYTAVTLFNLSWEELVRLGRMSLEHAFVEEPVKRALLAAYERRMAAFEAHFGAGNLDDTLAALAAVRPVAYGYARRTWGLSFP